MAMTVTTFSLLVAMPLLMIAVVLTTVRLVMGPKIADRVVALDTLGILGIGIIAVYAIATDTPLLIDAAAILALISFLSTVAFAYHLQRRVS